MPVLEPHHLVGGARQQIGDDEPDTWERLDRMPFDPGVHPSGRRVGAFDRKVKQSHPPAQPCAAPFPNTVPEPR